MAVTTSAITSVDAFSVSSTGTSTPAPASTGADDSYKWLLSWGIILLLLTLANKTRLGHVVIYYALWLMLLFLIVTQYRYISAALAPLGSSAPIAPPDK